MADLPATMTAIKIAGDGGGPEVLQPTTRPVPRPGAGEVLVKVAVAGVNRPDCLQRAGGYPPPPGASDIPGLELAGTVVAVGEGVSRWSVGDAVCALVAGGGYAEYCVCPEDTCSPIPSGYSMEQAAAVPENYYTVWTNVFERGRLQKGETILIHGGSSGIGTTAIQLAHAFGARVIATAGSAEKCKVCEELGAERAINYREDDFVDVVKELGGADVVLDMVGGSYIQRNVDCLKLEGRLVQIAFLQSPVVEKFNFLKVMLQRLTITGSTLRPRTVAQKAAIARQLEEKVWPLLAAGTVKPLIHTRFPLEQAAESHALMESSQHIGKIMLTVEGR